MSRSHEQVEVPWTAGVTRALTLASVLLALPLLAFEYIPFLDLPQQVGAVAVLAGGDPSWRLHDYYDIELLGSPYLLPYVVAAGLAKVVGAVMAVKILFAAAAAAWPWALSYAATSFGRDPRVGLLIAPIAYGTFAFMGFLNFVVAVVLWLAWLGWFRRAVVASTWTWRTWAIGTVLAVLLFYGHVMALGFAVGCAFVVALLASESGVKIGQRLVRGLHIAPGLVLFGLWAVLSPVAGEGDIGRMRGVEAVVTPAAWDPMLETAKGLLTFSVDVYQDGADRWLFGAMGLALLAGLATAGWSASTGGQRTSTHILAALVLAALILAFALPESYLGIWPIGVRMALFMWPLLLLVAPGPTRWPRAWLALGLAVTIATSTLHTTRFAAFQDEVGDLDAVLDTIEPGRRTMTLVYDRDSTIVRWPAYMHFSQYVIAAKGGVAEFSFANFTKSPIRYADINAPPTNPMRFEWTPHLFQWKEQDHYWDYVLVRDGGLPRPGNVFKGHKPLPEKVRAGPWVLYSRR